MTATNELEATLQSIHIAQDIQIAAPPAVVFESVLEELGPANMVAAMTLEPWPGGRWYRDLGNNAGHFWGHVQVIKPPTLLEITGPMFMSYPAVSHVQYRLTESEGGTKLALLHRAFGQITPEHQAGVKMGWAKMLEQIREMAEKRGRKKA